MGSPSLASFPDALRTRQALRQDEDSLSCSQSICLLYTTGEYQPPDCDFNRVTFNFTVTSSGRQFDRLALMYFGDVEILRTSTAEPTQYGIVWTYVKDMSSYYSLFTTPQKIIFDLGNIVDDTYTGLWNTTLTATFFTAKDTIEPADIILPVSARRSSGDAASAFVVPEFRAINNLVVPPNVKKAIFSISACGQAAEEFWWSNVLTSDTNAFGNETTLYGHSPFRELQLRIDGHMAGVAWPFPVIFTGGIVPGFWRPIVGIDAFDLREDEIDISPFLPLLSDNEQHTFEIVVMGIDDDGSGNGQFTSAIESNWVVSGKVFLWLDANSTATTGTPPRISAPETSVQLQSARRQSTNGTVDSLEYSIQVSRSLYIESTLHTSAGSQIVTWKQDLSFSNSGTLSNKGNDQDVQQTTTGTTVSSSKYSRSFEYPLKVISSYDAPAGGNVTIDANMDRGKIVQQFGELAFPNEWQTFDYTRLYSKPYGNATFLGSNVNNWQNGTASYLGIPAQKRSFGSGSTRQLFLLSGISGKPIAVVQGGTNQGSEARLRQMSEELYRRHIMAANDTIVFDDETFGDQAHEQSSLGASNLRPIDHGRHEFTQKGVRALLGRGPP